MPEWQYLRRKSQAEALDLWTMDMISAQLEKDLLGSQMILDGRKRRWEWHHGFNMTAHLHPYTFPEHGQGIYAIYEEEKLIYIGMSSHVIGRVDPTFTYQAVRMKPFQRHEVQSFEASLIRKYRPIYNTRDKPIYRVKRTRGRR